MSNKQFKKNVEPRCEYCVYGTSLEHSNEVLCLKRGITETGDFCRKYKYNPLKRVPKRQKISNNYKPEDFSL